MINRARGRQIGGTTVHVTDSYIWATISYLDSPTDYREFLHRDTRRIAVPGELLQMTDEHRHPRWQTAVDIVIVALLTVMAFSFLLGLHWTH